MASTPLGRQTSTSGGGQDAGGNSEGGLRRSTSSSVVGQAGEVVEVKEGDEASATTSPFDRLPDELFSLILSFLVATTYNNDLRRYYVNKRFRRLADPLWLANPVRTSWQQAKFFEAVILRPELATSVRQFNNTEAIDWRAFRYECAIMRQFVNLSSLTLSGRSPHGDVYLPSFMTDMLRSLPRLVDLGLEFSTPWVMEDQDFSIAKDLPRLRRFTVYGFGGPSSEALLATPLSTLDHLTLELRAETAAYACNPWSGLVSLELHLLTDNAVEDLDLMLISLEEAVRAVRPSALPLRRFKLHNLVFDDALDPAPYSQFIDVVPLFKKLSLTVAERLTFKVGSILVIPPELPALPAVKVLTLEANEYDMDDDNNYDTFLALLHRFPSLTHLRLTYFTFHVRPSPPSVKFSDPLSTTIDFWPLHPNLSRFLDFLARKTRVKQLEVLPMISRRRPVWWRVEGEEGWRLEVQELRAGMRAKIVLTTPKDEVDAEEDREGD